MAKNKSVKDALIMKTQKKIEEKKGRVKFAIVESKLKKSKAVKRKFKHHKKVQPKVDVKAGLVEPELQLLKSGYIPPETNLGTDFKGKNKVIISK